MSDKTLINTFITSLDTIYKKEQGQINQESLLKEELNTTSMQYFGIISLIQELGGKKISYGEIRQCLKVSDLLVFFNS